MGDTNKDIKLLELEQHRLNTFGNQSFVSSVDNAQLAKAGFFLSEREQVVKCFACNLKLKASDIESGNNVLSIHKEKNSSCPFIKKVMLLMKIPRWKSFLSGADSLRYEKARLDTFVNWPVSFMSPEELAKDGFYYLKRHDHCACIFCNGIIGSWEENDTPRGEHSKHFPQCSFIKGLPVGNVPMKQSLILSKFNHFSCTKLCNPLELISRNISANWMTSGSEDVTGLGKSSGNHPSKVKNGVNLKEFGLHEYRGPKHKEYITLDSRMNTFKSWPEAGKQRPHDLAEAGFYYCGAGDEVRCFHCGNGICNWENDDVPWEVHAAWYPKCSYVLLTKGQEYVSKMHDFELNLDLDSLHNFSISESELDSLMELDVMREVSSHNFPEARLREVLRKRIESKGVPFFSVEQCATAVFEYMEEETRSFLEETYLEDNNESEESSDTNSADLSASTSATNSTSSTSNNIAAALPELPNHTTPSPLLPLPQLKRHIPITSSHQPTSSKTARTTLPSVGMSGSQQQSLAVENGFPESRRYLASGRPPPAQLDFSEKKQAMPLTQQPVSIAQSKPSDLEEKSSDTLKEELDRARETVMCKVCLIADMSIVFLPCSHMATCASCALNLSTCPVCREEIKYTIKPILS